ncbi:MAG: hypothetical protein ACYC96_14030 [Fimbriimonadaceae bacterium]
MKTYKLLGPDGPYESPAKGLLGGYRPRKIYGKLDCYSADAAIRKGGYVAGRVFFKDEETAKACGYRPCAKCMPAEYKAWKEANRSCASGASLKSTRPKP